jgi:hypothetical protein
MCIFLQTIHFLQQQLLQEFCYSKELDKPVRRSEKRDLNEMMKQIRYPLKLKVQEPFHKTYVLLQGAIARVEIKEFSMKIEQAEIVESALRILSGLRELSIHHERGPLLESTILLERALRIRMWETGFNSIYVQCPGLSWSTRNGLLLRGVRTIGDCLNCSVSHLQVKAQCSIQESKSMIAFARLLHDSCLSVQTKINGGDLCISVKPENKPLRKEDFNVDPSLLPSFLLVVYDTKSSKILCFRDLKRCKDQISVYNSATCTYEFRIQHFSGSNATDFKSCLYCSNYAGIDSIYQEAPSLKEDAKLYSKTPIGLEPKSRSAPKLTKQKVNVEQLSSVPQKKSNNQSTLFHAGFTSPQKLEPSTKHEVNSFEKVTPNLESENRFKSFECTSERKSDPIIRKNSSFSNINRVSQEREVNTYDSLPTKHVINNSLDTMRRKASDLGLDGLNVKRLRTSLLSNTTPVRISSVSSEISPDPREIHIGRAPEQKYTPPGILPHDTNLGCDPRDLAYNCQYTPDYIQTIDSSRCQTQDFIQSTMPSRNLLQDPSQHSGFFSCEASLPPKPFFDEFSSVKIDCSNKERKNSAQIQYIQQRDLISEQPQTYLAQKVQQLDDPRYPLEQQPLNYKYDEQHRKDQKLHSTQQTPVNICYDHTQDTKRPHRAKAKERLTSKVEDFTEQQTPCRDFNSIFF